MILYKAMYIDVHLCCQSSIRFGELSGVPEFRERVVKHIFHNFVQSLIKNVQGEISVLYCKNNLVSNGPANVHLTRAIFIHKLSTN